MDDVLESSNPNSSVQLYYDYVIPSAISTLFHPLVTCRTLIMLGHEYDPPTLGLTVLGLHRLMYPNIFKYLGHVREDIGIYNLFTIGLPASVFGSIIKSAVCDQYLKKTVSAYFHKKSVIQTEQGIKVFAEETCKLMVGRSLGLIVTYPFQVIMIRQIAQIIGHETIYNNFINAFIVINANEGLPGLFSGLMPRLWGEIIAVWLTACFTYVLNKYVLGDKVESKIKEHTPYVASMIVSSCTHRLTVTSTVMAVSGSGLELSIPFKGSMDCYCYLSRRNAFIRGASFFFRYASGPL